MERKLAEAIIEAMDNSWDEAELYEEYSGRGMYGKTTCGVVAEGIGSVLAMVISNADLFVDDDGEPKFDAGSFRTDSMGRQIIIY